MSTTARTPTNHEPLASGATAASTSKTSVTTEDDVGDPSARPASVAASELQAHLARATMPASERAARQIAKEITPDTELNLQGQWVEPVPTAQPRVVTQTPAGDRWE